jgi:hypothetical protein
MVELLLKHHADPNGFVNASGNAVCAAKTPEIRRLLEAHGGFLDPYDLVWKGEDDEVMRIVTERPETALAGCGGVFTAVVTCGRRKLMRRLLDAGFKVHPQAGGCHSYLLERPDMLRELLTRGGLDPNYPTADGVTLLHELCHKDIAGGRWTIGRSVRRFCWSSAPIRHRRTRTARRPSCGRRSTRLRTSRVS